MRDFPGKNLLTKAGLSVKLAAVKVLRHILLVQHSIDALPELRGREARTALSTRHTSGGASVFCALCTGGVLWKY